MIGLQARFGLTPIKSPTFGFSRRLRPIFSVQSFGQPIGKRLDPAPSLRLILHIGQGVLDGSTGNPELHHRVLNGAFLVPTLERLGADKLTADSRKAPYPAATQATAAAHATSASARQRRRVGLLIRWRWMLKVL